MNQWAGTEAQRRAEVLGKTRLTDAQVSEIEERWVAGETLISLSTAFDCVPETIKKRLRDRGWQQPLNTYNRDSCSLTEYQRGYAAGFEVGRASLNGNEAETSGKGATDGH